MKKLDIIDKLLALSQITGTVDIQCRLQGRWHLNHVKHSGQAQLHVITQGEAYLHRKGKKVKRLQCGDMVFFPRTPTHQLSDNQRLGTDNISINQSQKGPFQVKKVGEEITESTLFCGHFYYDEKSLLMQQLPDMIQLNLTHPALQAIIQMLEAEAENPSQASRSMINALSTVFLILIIRTYLEQQKNKGNTGILYCWQDKRLSHLIRCIMHNPQSDWRIESMLEKASLSRAQLMRVFKQQLNTTPHAFVLNIRLQEAALLLRQTSQSVLQIALAVGFQSESHFGKVFRQHYQLTPKAYRQQL